MADRLKLYTPTEPFIITQGFAQNDACSEISSKPLSERKILGKVHGVCPIGYQEFYPLLGIKGHTGIDLSAKHGQPIYASCEGFVEELSTEPERGLGVGIISVKEYFWKTANYHCKHRYWHLLDIFVKKGQYVLIGDLIGHADNTGYSAGTHLHFEIKPVLKNAQDNWYNVLQTNGFAGGVDPIDYMDLMSAPTFAKLEEERISPPIEFPHDIPPTQKDQINIIRKGLTIISRWIKEFLIK